MAQPMNVTGVMQGSYVDAKYDSTKGRFFHSIHMYSDEPFQFQELKVPSGPYAGKIALIHVPAPRVSLDRLPLELRNMIYAYCYAHEGPINIRGQGSATRRKKFLYRGQSFAFSAITDYTLFMTGIGKSTRFFTHIHVRRSGCSRHAEHYKLLKGSPQLQTVGFAFPCQFRGLITTHVDSQFEDMKAWLLHDQPDQNRALERLRKVSFEIGPQQSGVLDQHGEPIVAMTPELRERCFRRKQGHLEKHFAKSKTGARWG